MAQGMKSRLLTIALMAAVLAALTSGVAAATKMKFWNSTANTITELYLAPVGTDQWGPNQCLNDDNKSVEADERLLLTGVTPGQYDVKLADEKGRHCTLHNITVKGGTAYAFSITEKQVKDCAQ